MAKVSTKFTPPTNGFRFINRFEIKLPIKFQLPLAGVLDLNEVVFGLCGGMCFAALDYYHSGKPVPEYWNVNEVDTGLLTYLCDRQLDSLRVPTLIKIIEWIVLEDKESTSRTLRTEIPKLRRSLDKGEPAVLCLIRTQGLENPTHNHQVLATGYEVDYESNCLSIDVYEPNYPGKDVKITVDLSRPSVSAPFHQSTGEPLRGFFMIPYRAQINVPVMPVEEPVVSFGISDDFRLAWPVDTRIVNQGFGENPDMYRPFKLPGHEGLDLYALTGDNVYACADGEVYQSEHPKDHPYGIQIRIKHEHGGKTYHTVYAHLSQSLVRAGDKVKSGQLIGKADNTGNSFGSHLHLTLKLDGAQTPGYPKGIIDPWPFLKASLAPVTEPPPTPEPEPDIPLPEPSGINVYTIGQVNLRKRPTTESTIVSTLPVGATLSVLGETASEKAKIGKDGEWLHVQTPSGSAGFVAAWFVRDPQQEAFPPSGLIVYPIDTVNLRSGPGTAFLHLGSLASTDSLSVLGDANAAKAKIGRQYEWLQVQTQAGQRGFVAAWLVHLTGQVPPSTDLVVYPTTTVNVRARPDATSNVLTFAVPGDALTVLGDRAQSLARIGQQGLWLNVRTPAKFVGYIASWLVTLGSAAPPAVPAVPATSLTVYPVSDLNIRAQASANSPRVNGAFKNEALSVIETDLNAARAKVGKMDAWLYVQKKDGSRGWAAAWFLSANPA